MIKPATALNFGYRLRQRRKFPDIERVPTVIQYPQARNAAKGSRLRSVLRLGF
jgi:hypothetical protein